MRFTSKRLSCGDVISEHVHGISLLRTFRNIGIERTVFMLANQQVLAAVRIQAVVAVDNQAGVVDALAFKRDIQIIADALRHDVFRPVLCAEVGELVVDVIHCPDVYGAAAGGVDVDLIDDVRTIAAAFNLGECQNDLFSHDLPRKYVTVWDCPLAGISTLRFRRFD